MWKNKLKLVLPLDLGQKKYFGGSSSSTSNCNFSEFFFELKIIEMTCLLILFKLSHEGLGRLLKKIAVRLIFRKVAFLEPATLLEMMFTSQVFLQHFYKAA